MTHKKNIKSKINKFNWTQSALNTFMQLAPDQHQDIINEAHIELHKQGLINAYNKDKSKVEAVIMERKLVDSVMKHQIENN